MKRMGRPKLKTLVQFLGTPDEIQAIEMLKLFFQVKTRHKLLGQVLLMTVLDVGGLDEDKSWTDEQQQAHRFCVEHKLALKEMLMLASMQKVLKEEPADAKMSVKELSQRANAKIVELMFDKEQLVEFAKRQGIDCAGLHKSGIIKRIREKLNAKR